MMDVIIYTDGSARNNPGKGGYGIVMISGNHRKEYSKGFKHTTNNRMELLSVIVALEKLKKDNPNVIIYSDSKYVVDSVEKGGFFHGKNNFFKEKNPDLWIQLFENLQEYTVKFIWVKGHSSVKENENVINCFVSRFIRKP